MGENIYRQWTNSIKNDHPLYLTIFGHPIIILFVIVIIFCAIFYIISLKSICCNRKEEKSVQNVRLHIVAPVNMRGIPETRIDNSTIGYESSIWFYALNGLDLESGIGD